MLHGSSFIQLCKWHANVLHCDFIIFSTKFVKLRHFSTIKSFNVIKIWRISFWNRYSQPFQNIHPTFPLATCKSSLNRLELHPMEPDCWFVKSTHILLAYNSSFNGVLGGFGNAILWAKDTCIVVVLVSTRVVETDDCVKVPISKIVVNPLSWLIIFGR